MAWSVNTDVSQRWEDDRGPIGGFERSPAGRTRLGPISAPNGTLYFIIVDNAGAVTAVEA